MIEYPVVTTLATSLPSAGRSTPQRRFLSFDHSLARTGSRWHIVRMLIREDNLESEAVRNLLREHREFMAGQSPPESDHSLDLEALRGPDITVWTGWENGELLGCGALLELDPRHGEIKSMRTASAHLRKGVAAALLRHIIDEARRRNFRRLSLETGSTVAFEPARAFYLRFAFEYCGPFADYVEDPHSVFMTRAI